MKRTFALAFALVSTSAFCQSTPDLLHMPSADVALYVAAHTQKQGEYFGDQHKLCGPMIKSKDDNADTTIALCANVNPKDGSADIYAVIGVVYYENLWNMFRSATLDNGKPLVILSDDKNFQDCDEGGCFYSDVMEVAIDSSAFARSRVDTRLGVSLEGDRHPVTVWLPAGYMAGLFTATTAPKQSPAVAPGVR